MTDPRDHDRTRIREAFIDIVNAEMDEVGPEPTVDAIVGMLDGAMAASPYELMRAREIPGVKSNRGQLAPPPPVSELARRLCFAYHEHYGTTGRPVPCGEHTAMARNLIFLTTPTGDAAFRVLLTVMPPQPVEFNERTDIEGQPV